MTDTNVGGLIGLGIGLVVADSILNSRRKKRRQVYRKGRPVQRKRRKQ